MSGTREWLSALLGLGRRAEEAGPGAAPDAGDGGEPRAAAPDPFADVDPPLSTAELRVVEDARAGRKTTLGDGERPEGPSPERWVRASLLRRLALGGPGVGVHERGLHLVGAWIGGDGVAEAETRGLDLCGCRVPHFIQIESSVFPDRVMLNGAVSPGLSLSRCALKGGLEADLLDVNGYVNLRGALVDGGLKMVAARFRSILDLAEIKATAASEPTPPEGPAEADASAKPREDDPPAAVNLAYAVIDAHLWVFHAVLKGSLDLSHAKIEGNALFFDLTVAATRGHAIKAESLRVGAVLADGAVAEGGANFIAAQVRGDFSVGRARLDAPRAVAAAKDPKAHAAAMRDGRWFSEMGGIALCLDRARIDGAFFLREGAKLTGMLDLTGASFGLLCDARESWPERGALRLDRCEYKAFLGGAPVSAKERLEWLDRQSRSDADAMFWPQPYEQCARVFRDMGHDDEAKTILIEKERRRRRAERRRMTNPLERPLHWFGTRLMEMVRYGHRPEYALLNAAFFVVFAWLTLAANADVMARTKAPDAAPALADATGGTPESRVAPPTPFMPFAYAVETFVPLVRLGQAEAFLPDVSTARGWWLQVGLWFHGFAGWLVGGVAAAGVLGLFRRG